MSEARARTDRYRIILDGNGEYRVQIYDPPKWWRRGDWDTIGGTTLRPGRAFKTVDEAEAYARWYASAPNVVKDLGELP